MPQSRDERLRRKREAEQRRYARLKDTPEGRLKLQEKEKAQYEAKKKKGIVKPIKQMTEREQRKKRKEWKRSSTTYRKKKTANKTAERHVAMNTPPQSDEEGEQRDPLSRQKQEQYEKRRRSNRERMRRYRKAKEREENINKLKKQLEKYKKKYYRAKTMQCNENERKITSTDTPNTRVKKMLQNESNRELVAKKLLFGEVLNDQLQENYQQLTSEKEKRFLKRATTGSIVESYRLRGALPKKLRCNKDLLKADLKSNFRRTPKTNRKLNEKMKATIQKFFEDDLNSRMAPGKKDCATKQGEKKQIRYLNTTMKNLHKAFLRQHATISYSSFCANKPFWVKQMKASERNTCTCTVCSNMELMVSSMHRVGLMKKKSVDIVQELFCCPEKAENCLLRTCPNCPPVIVDPDGVEEVNLVRYYQWRRVKETYVDEKTGQNKEVSKITKEKCYTKVQTLLELFKEMVHKYLPHIGRKLHQYKALSALKKSLQTNEAVIHMDFSENYATKYSEEVQAFHFGGSRKQISMHTVVVYVKVGEAVTPVCYCTLSESLRHDVAAIWSHLTPVLEDIRNKYGVSIIHFISDSPSTQYRNKSMFLFLGTQLKTIYPTLSSFTWNYLESGHGKGAPDGVGGVCKRTADRIVGEGQDVSTLEQLTEVLQNNVRNVKIFVIKETSIDDISARLALNKAKTFIGTMKVHQIVSGKSLSTLHFRALSSFNNDLDADIGKLRYEEETSATNRVRYSEVYSDDSKDLGKSLEEKDKTNKTKKTRRPTKKRGKKTKTERSVQNSDDSEDLGKNLEEKDTKNKTKKTRRPIKKRGNKTMRERAVQKKGESSDEDDADETYCLVCFESYSTSTEDWVSCVDCKSWSHFACTKQNKYYVCHNCQSE